jgi:hypothetical protein
VPPDNAPTRPLPNARPLDVDPDYVAGVVSARRELGPDAEAAVITAFLERTGYAIDMRVDQRIAQHRLAQPASANQAPGGGRSTSSRLVMALGSIALGVPVTGAATAFGGFSGVIVALVAWACIVLVNAAFVFSRP